MYASDVNDFKSDTKRKSSNSKFNCKLSNSNLNSKS